jgi:hypothetical protein
VRPVKARTGSPVARLPGSLTSNELVEVQRRRVTTLFARNEGLSQRPQADLTILKQPQGRPHNIAGRAVTARSNLILDERAESTTPWPRASGVWPTWPSSTPRSADRRPMCANTPRVARRCRRTPPGPRAPSDRRRPDLFAGMTVI